MFPRTLCLAVIAMLYVAVAYAQNDSSYYDAGNFSISKKFTQQITVKGEDLEHLPFSSLDEAINVYFFGAYTHAGNIVYVIDGNSGADANAYSIHDVESITLIQDARAIMNNTTRAKQLVLITTRTGFTKKSGFTIAASEHLVKDSTITPFHQVFASGRLYKKNLETGASLSYLHEAFSIETYDSTLSITPNRLNRFNINAWMTAALGRNNILDIRINYSPEDSGSHHVFLDWINNQYDRNVNAINSQFFPSLKLTTKISNKFYNQFSAGYISLYDRSKTFTIGKNGDQHLSDHELMRANKQKVYFAHEEAGFRQHAGKWMFNPAVSITGQVIKATTDFRDSTNYSYGGRMYSMSWNRNNSGQLYITPTIDVNHSDIFNIQAGVQYRLIQKINQYKFKEKIYPFGAIGLDLVKLFSPSSTTGLMMHASHAVAKSDLINWIVHPIYVYRYVDGVLDSVLTGNSFDISNKPHYTTSAGITLNILRERLKVSYNHERNNYYTNVVETVVTTGNQFIVTTEAQVKLATHRLGIEYNSSPSDKMKYKSVLGVYNMQSGFVYQYAIPLTPVIHQSNYPKRGWSGGWANHISYKKFTAGINILYYLNEHHWAAEPDESYMYQPVLHKKNSFTIQNIYGGYKHNNIELYLSARNLVHTRTSSFINGTRTYLGAGIKADL